MALCTAPAFSLTLGRDPKATKQWPAKKGPVSQQAGWRVGHPQHATAPPYIPNCPCSVATEPTPRARSASQTFPQMSQPSARSHVVRIPHVSVLVMQQHHAGHTVTSSVDQGARALARTLPLHVCLEILSWLSAPKVSCVS